MQLNAGAVFGHYSERLAKAKSFAGEVAYLLASQIASEVSWRGSRSLPGLCPCGILGRLFQLGSFQLFSFSILVYSLNKENKMKAFKDNPVFHKQMQNKAQEILSKVKNECCLFKTYLEWVSLLVDRSETSHSPNCNCNANSLVRGEKTGWIRVEIQLPLPPGAGNSFRCARNNTCESSLSLSSCHPKHKASISTPLTGPPPHNIKFI